MKLRYILLLALLVSFLPFCYYFYTYATNIAILDDYWAVYDFVWIAKIKFQESRQIIPDYLFSANLEHIIAYTKATSLILYYMLKDNFSLVYLMFIGDLSWILTLALMAWVFYRQLGAIWVGLAFFPLLGVSLQFHENYYWGMAAHQNFSVVFFSVVALYFLSGNTPKNVLIATLFGLMAYLSSSSGLVIFLIGTLMLFLQKRYVLSAIGLGLSGTLAVVLQKVAVYTPPIELGFHKLLNGFSFVGSIAHFEGDASLAIALGLVVCLFFAFYIFKWVLKKDASLSSFEYFFLGLILLVIMVGFIAGLKRPNVLFSRYKLYSPLAILSVIALIYYRWPKVANWRMSALLALAFVYNLLATYIYTYDIRKQYNEYAAETYNWHVNNKLTAQFQAFCDNDYYRNAMQKLNIYVPTDDKVGFLVKNLRNKAGMEKADTTLAIKTVYTEEKTVGGCLMKKLDVSYTLPDRPAGSDTYFVVLSSDEKDYVYSLFPDRNALLGSVVEGNLYKSPLTHTIHLQYLPSDTYQLSVIRFHKGKAYVYTDAAKQIVKI